jgi:hypothetical protein
MNAVAACGDVGAEVAAAHRLGVEEGHCGFAVACYFANRVRMLEANHVSNFVRLVMLYALTLYRRRRGLRDLGLEGELLFDA